MKLFKKILLIGICIFAMGSVTACGNNNATDGTNNEFGDTNGNGTTNGSTDGTGTGNGGSRPG